MNSNHSIDVEAAERTLYENEMRRAGECETDITYCSVMGRYHFDRAQRRWEGWLAAKRSIAQPAADPAPVPAQTGVDAVERIIEVIKAAPAHIAARADMSPKGNMIGEFPAQGIDHAKLDERAAFEAWLLFNHALDSKWSDQRNCFEDCPAHLAFKAWQARGQQAGVAEAPTIAAEMKDGVIRVTCAGLKPGKAYYITEVDEDHE